MMTVTMWRAGKWFGLLGSVWLVLAGCGGSSSGLPSGTQVRAFVAIPGVTGATLTVGGTVILTSGNFGSFTGYVSSPNGSQTVILTNGSGTVIAQSTVTLANNGIYTIYADGTQTKPNLFVSQETETTPNGSNVLIEALDLSTALTTNVDVYVTAPGAALTTPALTNIPFQGTSSVTLPNAQYQITFTATGTQTVVASYTTEGLPGGTIPRYVLIDSPNGGAPQSITALFDAG